MRNAEAARAVPADSAYNPSRTAITTRSLERLIHRTRVAVSGRRDTWEADLSAMVADSEMQCELSRINAEFSIAEADGLETH